MPVIAGILDSDILALLLAVGEHQYFRTIRQKEFLRDMNFVRAKMAAKADMPIGCQILIAKDDHLILVEGLPNGLNLGSILRSDIDAGDFRAKGV